MESRNGYYSFIQFCPDPGRMEAANVGVLLFHPETGFLKALTKKSNKHLRKFFGSKSHNWDHINSFKNGLVDRIEKEKSRISTLGELELFIGKRANNFQITKPMPIKVSDPETTLRSLFKEFFGDPEPRPSTPRFRSFLGNYLNSPELRNKVKRDVQVQVPIFNRILNVPFGYQNGRFNLISPVYFDSNNGDAIRNKACGYALDGDSIYSMTGSNLGLLQLVVVAKFGSRAGEVEGEVRNLLDNHNVKVYTEQEIPRLVDNIKREGKELQVN